MKELWQTTCDICAYVPIPALMATAICALCSEFIHSHRSMREAEPSLAWHAVQTRTSRTIKGFSLDKLEP